MPWAAAAALSIRAGHRVLLLATALLLARSMGAEGYGVYAYAVAWGLLLSTLATFGLPALLIREIATYRLQDAWGYVRGVLRRSQQTVLVASVIAGLALLGATRLASDALDGDVRSALTWAALLIPILATARLRAGALRGLQRVLWGESLELVILPACFFVMVAVHLALGPALTGPAAMRLYVFAAAVALGVGAIRVRVGLPTAARRTACRFADERWRRSALQLGLMSAARVVNQQADIVMLGILAGAPQAGVYRLAFTGSLAVSFSEEAIGALIAPRIARLYAAGDRGQLQRLLTRSTRAVVLISLVVAVALIASGRWLLVVLFGQEFGAGYAALAILTAGRLLQVTAGPGTLVLNMTGHDEDAARGLAASSLLNIALNAALIPRYGMTGAATATLISTLVWSYLIRHLAQRRLGLDPSLWHRTGPPEDGR